MRPAIVTAIMVTLLVLFHTVLSLVRGRENS